MKLMTLAAIAAAATLTVPMTAEPAAAKRHVTWKTVCKTKWQHRHRVRTCHRVKVWR